MSEAPVMPRTQDQITGPGAPHSSTPARVGAAPGQVQGHTVTGQEVVDGKVWDNGRWVEGAVFDPMNYTVTVRGGNKEAVKTELDGHKEVGENFRKAILGVVDGLGANAYDVELRWHSDGASAEFSFSVKKGAAKDPLLGDGYDTPLAQATLPREKTAVETAKDAPKTAEERDAKAIREGTVPHTPIYGTQTKANPAGVTQPTRVPA